MNLHEIEETLHQLSSRHSDLDEQMLVTLLRSGGWEEKNIQEALLLFRSQNAPRKEGISQKSFPPTQENPVLMPQADENHLLLDHNEDGSLQATPTPEPQSLVEPDSKQFSSGEGELPHNLPLRPFETSEHVWPFSRYRDVFYGEPEIVTKPEASKEGNVPEPTLVKTEEKKSTPSVRQVEEKTDVEVEVVPVPLTKGDEGLIVLACVMLLAVLLLLGYMYSNGRL